MFSWPSSVSWPPSRGSAMACRCRSLPVRSPPWISPRGTFPITPAGPCFACSLPWGLAPLHLRGGLLGGQVPPHRASHPARPRYPLVGARPGFPLCHGHVLHGALPGPAARTRAGVHFRHLHGPGMESHLRVLSQSRHAATRAGGGDPALPPLGMAPFHPPRAAGGE